jgi:predicted RND superfamily exporter protein
MRVTATEAAMPGHDVPRAVAAMVVLAGLDLVGALLARHWSQHRSLVALGGGMAVFALLFAVYGKSLDYAHLTTVTLGWLVLLQLGVMALDGLAGTGTFTWDRVVAMVGILGLQGYLTLTG